MKIDTFVDSAFDHTCIPQELQTFLANARMKHSIAVETLARRSCVDVKYIIDFESGIAEYCPVKITRLANILNVHDKIFKLKYK